MNLLLDTCAVLHITLAPQNLSSAAHSAVMNSGNSIYVSAVTAGELACLEHKHRVTLPAPWYDWFLDKVQRYGWSILPITAAVFPEAYALPGQFHADPADRIVVASARDLSATVVTTDKLILDYPHVPSLR